MVYYLLHESNTVGDYLVAIPGTGERVGERVRGKDELRERVEEINQFRKETWIQKEKTESCVAAKCHVDK